MQYICQCGNNSAALSAYDICTQQLFVHCGRSVGGHCPTLSAGRAVQLHIRQVQIGNISQAAQLGHLFWAEH